MNILILNPVGRLSDGRYTCLFPSRWDAAMPWKIPFHYYPYELGYLSSLLKRDFKRANVKLLDPNALDLNWQEACQMIDKSGMPCPDYIITECSALTYPDMTRLMQHMKKWTSFKAWLCGPYGQANETKALANGWDQVFRGEYEQDVLWELQGWTRTRECEQGVMYRTIPNAMEPGWEKKKPLVDLDSLPFPEDEDIRRIDYHECSNPYSGMVQLYPTRGCPLACSFCVVPSYYGGHGNSFQSHRVRDVNSVCEEISYLARRYEGKFSGCFFNEETHNANAGWLESFAEQLIRRSLNRYHFDAMCGYWTFTEPLIKLLGQAGYCQIRIGIENLSEASGRAIGKRIIPEKLAKVLEWCKAAGIAVYGTTQMGAPGSTFQSDIATLETLIGLKREGFIRTWQNSISTPQPGTPMYNQAKSENRLLTEDGSLYDGNHVVMEIPGYPKEKIEEVRQMWMRHQGIG